MFLKRKEKKSNNFLLEWQLKIKLQFDYEKKKLYVLYDTPIGAQYQFSFSIW